MMCRIDEPFIDGWSLALPRAHSPPRALEGSTDERRRPWLELEARSSTGAHTGLRVDLGDAQQFVGSPPGALPCL